MMKRILLLLLLGMLFGGGGSVIRAQNRLYGFWGIPFGSSRAEVKREMASRANGILWEEEEDALTYARGKFAEEYEVTVVFGFVKDQLYGGSIVFGAENWEETTLFLIGYLQLLYPRTEQFTDEDDSDPLIRNVVCRQFKNGDLIALSIGQTPEGKEQAVVLAYASDSLSQVMEAEERMRNTPSERGNGTRSDAVKNNGSERWKRCLYEGPGLSFGFRYPADMKESPAKVQSPIKKVVISEDPELSFGVTVWDLGADAAQIRKDMESLPLAELKKNIQSIMQDQELEKYNLRLLDVQRGYTIDRLPAIFFTQTMDIPDPYRTGHLIQWGFLVVYKTKIFQLLGTTVEGAGDLKEAQELFLSIVGTFSILSQAENKYI